MINSMIISHIKIIVLSVQVHLQTETSFFFLKFHLERKTLKIHLPDI